MPKTLSRYKFMVEALGLKQLDVYRVREKGAEVDILRLYEPSLGKVVRINLGTVRESLDYKEFLNRLLKSLEEAGIRISEKKLSKVVR